MSAKQALTTETKTTKHKITGALGFLLANGRDDLSVRQLSVMLACVKKKQTVRGLAEALDLSKPAIVRAVDKLEGDGIMVRTPDDADRRSVFLSLTDAGKEFSANFA